MIGKMDTVARRRFAAALAAGLGCGRGSKESAGTRVRIAIFRGEEFTPLAQALGHFREEGLETEVLDVPSSSKAMQALFGGSADVVTGGFDHAVRLAAEGRNPQSFVVLTTRSPLALVASPQSPRIRRVEDLKGAKVGVSAFGSSGNHFVNFLLHKHGLRPADVQYVATGGGHAVTVASIERGQLDAIVTLPASLAILRARFPGLVILGNGTTLEGTREIFGVDHYPGVCLMAPAPWIAANRDTAARLARAMKRTLTWVRGHSAEQLQRSLPNRAADSAVAAEELEGLRATIATASENGRMPAGGPEAVRDLLAVTYPEVRAVKLADTYTDALLGDAA